MSTLQVRNIQGLSNFSNEVSLPSGHTLRINGNLDVPTWNNSTRPNNPNTGFIGYNTEEEALEVYNGTEWQSAGSAKLDGSSPDKASTIDVILCDFKSFLVSKLILQAMHLICFFFPS